MNECENVLIIKKNVFKLKELDLKLIAVKGIGKDHAKFSPVGKIISVFSLIFF